jgi:membrane protein
MRRLTRTPAEKSPAGGPPGGLTGRVTRLLDGFQRRSAAFRFLMAVLRKFADDQAGNLASLLAYYAFLALFPLLLVLVTVLGIVLRDDPSAQQRILNSALVDFPVIGTQLRSNIQSLGRSGVGLVIGLIGTAIGARGVSIVAQRAFNTAWAVPYARRPSYVGRQLRSLGLLAVVGLAVISTGSLSSIASIGGVRGLAVQAGALAASALLNVGFFLLGFRLATSPQVPTHDFARAAAVAALAWQVLLSLGSYLVTHDLRHSEDVYGVFGLVLGLIAWLHVQAQLTLLLLEADVVRGRQLSPRAINGDMPMEAGDRRAYTAYAQAQQRRRGVTITVAYDEAQDVPAPPAQGALDGPPDQERRPVGRGSVVQDPEG